MARQNRQWAGLCVAVLLVALALRLNGLDWDGLIGAHPDERFMVSAAEGLRFPDRLNPFATQPDYAYGHLPLYVLALLASLNAKGEVLPVARAIAALCDVGTVALTGGLARRLYGKEAGWLAMACVGLAMMHVQQAHFFTSDVVATMWATAALWWCLRLSGRGRASDAVTAGACLGLAVGSKLSMALLVLPAGAACMALPIEQRWRRALIVAAAGAAAFAVTNPYALVDISTFWRNALHQAAIARGTLDAPYTRQYHGTWLYLYPLEQQFRWGLGVMLGLVACMGLAHGVWSALRRAPKPAEWVLLAWVVPGLAFFGGLYAKFPRYLLPLVPVLCVYGARFMLLAPTLQPFATRSYRPRRSQRWGTIGLALLLGDLLVRALAYGGMVALPHPWVAASQYLRESAPAATVIAVEAWDQPLPLDATGFELRTLPIFDDDTPEKWAAAGKILASADIVVIASQRGYGALARWPQRYPQTARYYEQLFAGGLGFEPLACFERAPRLGEVLALVDDPSVGLDVRLPKACQPKVLATSNLGRLDESFTVYDHPIVVIFGRSGPALSAEDLQARISGGAY